MEIAIPPINARLTTTQDHTLQVGWYHQNLPLLSKIGYTGKVTEEQSYLKWGYDSDGKYRWERATRHKTKTVANPLYQSTDGEEWLDVEVDIPAGTVFHLRRYHDLKPDADQAASVSFKIEESTDNRLAGRIIRLRLDQVCGLPVQDIEFPEKSA